MVYTFTGRGIAITEELQAYAEKRFEHLNRLLGATKIEPFLSADFEFHAGENVKYVVRATLDAGDKPMHAECQGTTLHEAIDTAAKSLAYEIRKSKGKRIGFARRQAGKLKNFMRGFRN